MLSIIYETVVLCKLASEIVNAISRYLSAVAMNIIDHYILITIVSTSVSKERTAGFIPLLSAYPLSVKVYE